MKPYCECEYKGVLQPGMAGWYDSKTELPFVKHKPGECKCTNDLKDYLRDGKVVTLCSCCWTSRDRPVKSI